MSFFPANLYGHNEITDEENKYDDNQSDQSVILQNT